MFREQAFELLAFVTSCVLLITYVVINFIQGPSSTSNAFKLVGTISLIFTLLCTTLKDDPVERKIENEPEFELYLKFTWHRLLTLMPLATLLLLKFSSFVLLQVRLVLTLVLGTSMGGVGLVLGYSYWQSKSLIFRTVGADASIQAMCSTLFTTITLIMFDAQIVVGFTMFLIC